MSLNELSAIHILERSRVICGGVPYGVKREARVGQISEVGWQKLTMKQQTKITASGWGCNMQSTPLLRSVLEVLPTRTPCISTRGPALIGGGVQL